jgi:hypothetical protein
LDEVYNLRGVTPKSLLDPFFLQVGWGLQFEEITLNNKYQTL